MNAAVSAGDTAWLLAASAMVLLMAPGLALFYGGMVRAKHALTMLMQNFACIGIVSVTWICIGFSWGFGGTGKYLGATGRVVSNKPVPGTNDADVVAKIKLP